MTTFPSQLADRLAKTVANTQRLVATAHQRLNNISTQVSALQPAVANTQDTLLAVKSNVAGVTFDPPTSGNGYGVGSTPQSPNNSGTSGNTGSGVTANEANINGAMNYNNTNTNTPTGSNTFGTLSGPYNGSGSTGACNYAGNTGDQIGGAASHYHSITTHTHSITDGHYHALGTDSHTHNMQHDHAYGDAATDINNLWNQHNALVAYYNTLRTCYSDTYNAVDNNAFALNNLATQHNALLVDHANLTATVANLQTQVTTSVPDVPQPPAPSP